MDTLGKNIRQIRKNLGLSQQDLEAKSGVSQQTISNIESGFRSPSIDKVQGLARALEMTVDALLSEDGMVISLNPILSALSSQIGDRTDAREALAELIRSGLLIQERGPQVLKNLIQASTNILGPSPSEVEDLPRT